MNYSFDQKQQQKQQQIVVPYQPIWSDNVLSSTEIQQIIEIGENESLQGAKIGDGRGGKLDGSVRRTLISWIPPEIAPNWFYERIKKIFGDANDVNFKFELSGAEPAQYTKYEASFQGEYKWHSDIMHVEFGIRKISVSILLSDPSEYEGGHLILAPHGVPMTITEKKGRAIFFPSFVPHCVTPVVSGTRRSLVIWAHGDPFK